MVTILYGLCGEGMGHAIRSKVVIEHLVKKGHDVHIVASGRAYDFLAKNYSTITRLSGLTFHYERNTVHQLKTLLRNLRPGPGKDAGIVYKVMREKKPELIISDFEPTVVYLAGFNGLKSLVEKRIPLISMDNQHIATNCEIEVPKRFFRDYLIVKYGNDIMVPRRNVSQYLVTTFFYPKLKRKNTTLVPSLIRDSIINKQTSNGEYILVYQTSQSYTAMFDILKKFSREKFIVYGFNVSKREKNCLFKKFSEKGFVDDLAACKAVITNGGYTVISEAIFLHKPIFSIPIKKQFEQICNAIYLDKLGYGKFHREIGYKGFSSFLYHLPDYKDQLEKYKQKDNSIALQAVDRAIKKLV